MEAYNKVQQLFSDIRKLHAYHALKQQIEAKQSVESLSLIRSSRLPIISALFFDLDRPVVYLTDRSDRAFSHLDEIRFWLGDQVPFNFPAPTPLFYEKAEWGAKTRRDRLQCLSMLAALQKPVTPKGMQNPLIIMPCRAIMTRTLSRRDYIRYTKQLKRGQEIPPETIRRDLVNLGYESADSVYEPGFFTQRGGILDFWVPSEHLPIRLDFFGDELDTIRQFDPASQRSMEKLERVSITPAREILAGEAEKQGVPHDAINEFNKICPIKGGLLNRKHIQTIGTYTHITRELFITDCLSACVTIIDSKYKDELLEHEDKLIIRPIISTPLSFNNSGVEHVIRIINVQLELEL